MMATVRTGGGLPAKQNTGTVIKCREQLRSSTSRTDPGRTVIKYTEEPGGPSDPTEPYDRAVIKDSGQPRIPTVTVAGLPCDTSQSKVAIATPLKRGPKGPVPKRRFQEGTFRKENGHYYSFFYRDRTMPDGTSKSVKERFDHGKIVDVSELSARRQHDRLRQQINHERGSVPTAPRGETFTDAAKAYVESVAPHLSCSTVRQQQSHLRCHLLPRFATVALIAFDVNAVQRFATDMLRSNSRKTIINVLGTLFAILHYARRCGTRVPEFGFSALTIAADKGEYEPPYFKPEDVRKIVGEAKQPYKTIFALAWATGLRAGELLGLSVVDLDFQRGVIQPRKQADDRTRMLRHLKTRKSKSVVAMTPETVALLTEYLTNHWQENPDGLLFPNRTGRPRKRANVVRFGLKPLLIKFGLPTQDVGLHAFRHGLGTALSENKVSPKTVQQILRHTDIKTTFRYYVHSDTESQRTALAAVAIGTNVPISTAGSA
jgi:integrase